jgi:hypothetical protein
MVHSMLAVLDANVSMASLCWCLQVLIDLKEVASGSLFEDWDMLPPKVRPISQP